MDKLKKSIQSYFVKDPIEKHIIKIKQNTKPQIYSEESLNVFIQGVDGKFKEYNTEKVVKTIINNGFYEIDHWVPGFQFLSILHRLMGMYGQRLAFKFARFIKSTQDIKYFRDYENLTQRERDLEKLLHVPLLEKYYEYLINLSRNYDYRDMCSDLTLNGKIDKIFSVPYHRLISKIHHNLINLKQVLKTIPKSFEQTFFKYKDYSLTKHVAGQLLNDLIFQYDINSQVIEKMIDDIFEKQEQEAILLYNLYEEIVYVTKQIKQFYKIKNMLLETSVVQPKYFKIDEIRNRKIELHMINLSSGSKTFTNLALLNKQRYNSPQKLSQQSLVSGSYHTNQRRKQTLDIGYNDYETDMSCVQDLSSMQLQIISKNNNNHGLFKQSTKDTTCNSPVQKSMISSKRNSVSQIDLNNLGTILGSSISPRDKNMTSNKQQIVLDDDYINQEENKENCSSMNFSNGKKQTLKTNLVYYNENDQQFKLQPHRQDGFSGQSSLIFTGGRFSTNDHYSYKNKDSESNINSDAQLQEKKLYIGTQDIYDDDKFSFQYTVKNRSKKNSMTDTRKGSITSEGNSNSIQIQLEKLEKEDEIC